MTSTTLFGPHLWVYCAGPIVEFMARAAQISVVRSTIDTLHKWSVRIAADPGRRGTIAAYRRQGERVLADGDKMPGARFFPDASLSAENSCGRPAQRTRWCSAANKVNHRLSWDDLQALVSKSATVHRARRQEGRPRRRDDAEHAGNHCLHAGNRFDRCDLVVLFTDFGEQGCWTASVRSNRSCSSYRWLLVCRQAHRGRIRRRGARTMPSARPLWSTILAMRKQWQARSTRHSRWRLDA